MYMYILLNSSCEMSVLNLVDLPFDVLRHIASFLEPEDIAKCSLTCGRLYNVP